jgi:superfamily II DNA or RNA helicase
MTEYGDKSVDAKIRSVRQQLAALDTKRSALTELLAKLESQRTPARSPDRVADAKVVYQPTSVSEAHIRLFMKLFNGRTDVFPKRWENRAGRSGYSPACRNEWVRGVCRKPKVKCAECESREFVPLIPDVVRKHLLGQMTIGVYPLLKDETCAFLAADFDKKDWMEDVSALLDTCQRRGIECAVERSRSGNGAHVWFFFEKPIPARLARRFGCALLTETMEKRHQIGLDSYDRFFPSQDTLPKGGFGNLIALPLQSGPAKQGNSLFVDDDFNPYPDQWEFLRSIKPLAQSLVQSIEEEAVRRGRVVGVRMSISDDMEDRPWMIPPSGHKKAPAIHGKLPKRVSVVRANLLFIEKKDLPSGLINRIVRLAAFQNPKFYEAQAVRRSTFNTPRVISCAEEFEKHLALPRGCFEELLSMFTNLGIEAFVDDKRNVGRLLDADFNGDLLPEQEDAVAVLLANDVGVLSAPPGFGKTVVGARLIAERKTNTLVLIHRKQLLDQWRARLAMFLGIDEKAIGQLGGSRDTLTGVLDVAMIQSLNRKGVVQDVVADYGHVILDECHHGSAVSFEQVLRQAKAKYVLGLTATPTRKDGDHPIIFMQCGPIRYEINPRRAARDREFEHQVVTRQTATTLDIPEEETKIHEVYKAIAEDAGRTALVADDVRRALSRGRSPLILTERRDHLEALADEMDDLGTSLFILHGGIREKKRKEVVKAFQDSPEGEPRVLLATGKYIGEGFDDARLDTLFLTSPISWKGILQQYAGRLHRAHHAKKAVIIYDYVDIQIPMARRMFERRKRGYAALGYTLDDPAQAALPLE